MNELDNIRNEIDEVDRKLTKLFEKRMELVKKVADYKKKNNLPVLNSKREKEVITKNISYLKNKELSNSLEALFINLMNVSKKLEENEMGQKEKEGSEIYGLLGEKLGHSFSPEIHESVFQKSDKKAIYNLFEIPKDKLKEALEGFKLISCKGINVTIPYKTDVIKFLDYISKEAENIGAVNTLKFSENKLGGYNTDYIGFGKMLEKFDVKVRDSICAVLGSGGAAKAVIQYLSDNKCKKLYIVSRNPEKALSEFGNYEIIDYKELGNIKNGDIIVNCTPAGMFPKTGVSPVNKEIVARFSTAVDLIYNPLETEFLKHARESKVKAVNGLYMLVSQAIASEEIWNDTLIDEEIVDEIYESLIEKVSGHGEK
ncbi:MULTISPECIES: shikimate dehydrogenase [Clostridium]|uniref:shikimate dehydrogenase n=1 Tax=Clostridium TaxID=1485 RepID=UPI00069E9C9B|nr:chorismate mutase [Clostridium sp. DMHC 10]